VHRDTDQTLQTIERSVAGITAAELTHAAGPQWPAESVLEHLDLTYSGTITNMRKALERGVHPRPKVWMQRVATWLICDLGFFPSGFKAPETATPRGGRGAEVIDSIRRNLREMDAVMIECDEKLGPQATFNHPRLGPLTTAQWRRFHLVHARHHMKQLARHRQT
jgi:hypothetical protein